MLGFGPDPLAGLGGDALVNEFDREQQQILLAEQQQLAAGGGRRRSHGGAASAPGGDGSTSVGSVTGGNEEVEDGDENAFMDDFVDDDDGTVYDEPDDFMLAGVSGSAAARSAGARGQRSEQNLRKLDDGMRVVKLSGASSNAVKAQVHRDDANSRHQRRDKSDRATTENVLDPRTKLVLFKMLNKGVIARLEGCISTGKEANVYYAPTDEGGERAVKVYKTSVLSFKDRDRYVTGEFRFRNGYCKSNPRKMVKVWAEKEFRNLMRMRQAGIPSPEPVLLRLHVLVMEFIGANGVAAPRLKDAQLSSNRMRECYAQCVRHMRRLFHQCRLVHADLSEYNMLYFKKTLYIIDVSQSVEHDHPQALTFLRMDCTNVTDYFVKSGVSAMTPRELFEFIVDPTIGGPGSDAEDAYLNRMQKTILSRVREEPATVTGAADSDWAHRTNQQLVDDAVFQHAYIPRTLDEVIDVERDVFERAAEGDASTRELHYQKVTGLRDDLQGAKASNGERDDHDAKAPVPEVEQNGNSGGEEDGEMQDEHTGESSDSSLGDAEEPDFSHLSPRSARKAHKKWVKADKAEKRKDKVPKHIKKRKKRQGAVKAQRSNARKK